MIFYESFENRVEFWYSFREKLEKHPDPLNETIRFWNQAPISYLSCDPFDQSTWLSPWDLLEENNYCEFSKILAIYYTLSLTDRFKDSYFEIQVIKDTDAHELKYILIMDEFVIGYLYDKAILQTQISSKINIQASYSMQPNE